MTGANPLHVRWLGRVPYREALALQHGLFANGRDQHLLLLEHPHVFTHGANADLARNLRCTPSEVGAELVEVQRGGDVTYHGPGQLVGYPILDLPPKHGGAGAADVRAYVSSLEQLVIDALAELGLPGAGRMGEYPGVWIGADGPSPRKICAIGVRTGRGSGERRTMHGFALNVSTDLEFMRRHIVPCGIDRYDVTSLAEEGVVATMRDVVDVVARLAAERFGCGTGTRADVAWRHVPEDLSPFSRGDAAAGAAPRRESRLAEAGVSGGLSITARKPEWIRPRVSLDDAVLATRRTVRDLGLVTVCEEAGCPNLSECWADGTATFMVLGERCTRACGFCLVDTRKPGPADAGEPGKVAEAVARMGLEYAVLTMVARDDLDDDGMAHVAACVRAIRARCPGTSVEVLVSDARGSSSLDLVLAERPDVFNHNVETVARLQRAVRPSAGYARSLSVLARASAAGLTVKSGIIVGMGETEDEVREALVDLASVGTRIVTIGQYLRPTEAHLPVARWVEPAEFARLAAFGESVGLAHVEASPLTRSSYHAKDAQRRSLPLLQA
ncbi:MAG: lipoyl synthase [Actinobacteria bacterium]|nr:lipoyl synthase [Actinomycetota bacterium]